VVAGASVNAYSDDGRTPLISAAQEGHMAIVRLLCLDFNANVHTSTPPPDMMSPLAVAAVETRSLEITMFLVSQRANPNSRYGVESAVLIECAIQNDHLIVEFLCSASADANRLSALGDTPLDLSVAQSSADVTRTLLEYQANVNFENQRHETALHIAALRGDLDQIRLLLGARGDADVSSSSGWTPFDLAVRGGMSEASALLRSAMVSPPRSRRWRSHAFSRADA
jgi:ankyrin repeat protein